MPESLFSRTRPRFARAHHPRPHLPDIPAPIPTHFHQACTAIYLSSSPMRASGRPPPTHEWWRFGRHASHCWLLTRKVLSRGGASDGRAPRCPPAHRAPAHAANDGCAHPKQCAGHGPHACQLHHQPQQATKEHRWVRRSGFCSDLVEVEGCEIVRVLPGTPARERQRSKNYQQGTRTGAGVAGGTRAQRRGMERHKPSQSNECSVTWCEQRSGGVEQQASPRTGHWLQKDIVCAP
jgi:hypothetical protein